MVMKNKTIALFAGCALLAGCAGNDPVSPVPQDTRITLSLSELDGTRGTSSEGGLSNMDGHEMTFTVAVIAGSGEEAVAVYGSQQTAIVSGGSVTPVDFTARLVPGETYTLIAYANFSGTNGVSLPDDATEADYLTALSGIGCTYTLNDEASDSYFATRTFVPGDENLSVSLVRPCAKITVLNTGSALTAASTVAAELSDAYSLTNSFDALTGNYVSTTMTSSIMAAKPLPTGYEGETEQTLMTLYVPVESEGVSTCQLKLTVTDGAETVEKTMSIPVERNRLTVIRGDFSN